MFVCSQPENGPMVEAFEGFIYLRLLVDRSDDLSKRAAVTVPVANLILEGLLE